jgi:hypothetical protein
MDFISVATGTNRRRANCTQMQVARAGWVVTEISMASNKEKDNV